MCLGDHQAMSPMDAAVNWGNAYSQRHQAANPNASIPAGRDHRAFARHTVNEHPILGAPAMVASIPAYSGAKSLGIMEGGSNPDMNTMAQAYRGVADGLKDILYRNMNQQRRQ